MTKTVGLIPAGGSALRFKGVWKELLPISQTDCALSRCIKAMQSGGAESIYVATKPEKIAEHWKVIENIGGVHLTARPFASLWEFIARTGETVKADKYFFAMPDTVFPVDAFQRDARHDVTCGAFYTKKAGRFGILTGNHVVDKSPSLIGDAWGVWIWSGEAMEYLTAKCRETKDHTAALNCMLERFGVDTFYMPYYYDFAAFEDYTEFLCSLT
jgi:hypothetical protein